MEETVYIALGSNLGDRDQHLADARDRIAALPGIRAMRVSRIEETAPLGPVEQGPYLNQMIAVETILRPHALLDALQSIEQIGGRERSTHWGPRTIDLDIVLFEHTRCDDPDLIVPHPHIPNREFWRHELAELGAPGFAASVTSHSFSPELPSS